MHGHYQATPALESEVAFSLTHLPHLHDRGYLIALWWGSATVDHSWNLSS